MKKIIDFVLKHKIVAAIAVIVIGFGIYFVYGKFNSVDAQTTYTLTSVEKGSVITSVSGSGQVSASDQIEIMPKASGELLSVNVKAGQEVKEGDVLMQIDSIDANKTVRDAQINLETAVLSLEKVKEPATDLEILKAELALESAKNDLDELKNPADEYSLMQAENALLNAQNNLDLLKITQENNYAKALETIETTKKNIENETGDAFNSVSNAFLDIPEIITEIYDILYGDDISKNESSAGMIGDNMFALMNSLDINSRDDLQIYQDSAISDYNKARVLYNPNFENYKSATRYSEQEVIDSLLDETIETVRALAQAAKSENDYLSTWEDIRERKDWDTFFQVDDFQNDLENYLNILNSHLSSLLSAQTNIQNNHDSLDNAQRDLSEMEKSNPNNLVSAENSVKEKQKVVDDLKDGADDLEIKSAEATVKQKQAELDDLKDGADYLDVRSAEITVQQRQNTLTDAQEKLSDYAVKAPIDGIIAVIDKKKGDTVSSGASVAIVITKQKIAEISLNEVDVAQVKLDQKATLIFDAVSDLTITGKVEEVDAIGTVSQGVVTYNVKIVFDTQDERIKPGMSVSASIITDMVSDVLVVPNSAVKTNNESSYVEILENSSIDNSDSSVSKTVASDVAPIKKTVEVGLADDSMTEIKNGISEGDYVVTKTSAGQTTSAAATSSSQNKNIFQMGGMEGGPPTR